MLTDRRFSIRIIVGYIIAYFSFFPFIHRHRQIRKRNPDALQPEARLYWLLFSKSDPLPELGMSHGPYIFFPSAAPLEAIGLFGFAWTSLGPPQVHWIAPLIFATLVGIANVKVPST